ncbi:hypothetical protein EDD37DRAFT_371449 [Exophiala viscosa]|uniref:uncharacterized protein n=1 Tax=Exophiala viscosa TaxID=2486360 RepID=UPI00219F3DDB|nr:hypothetical protein EDD37DRAFT_371449 [Exophiala viscosa]
MFKTIFYALLVLSLSVYFLNQNLPSVMQLVDKVEDMLPPEAKDGISRATDIFSTLFDKLINSLPLDVQCRLFQAEHALDILFYKLFRLDLHGHCLRLARYHTFDRKTASFYLGYATHKLQQLSAWVRGLPWNEWKTISLIVATQIFKTMSVGTQNAVLYIRNCSWQVWFNSLLGFGKAWVRVVWVRIVLALLVKAIAACGRFVRHVWRDFILNQAPPVVQH